MNTVRSLNMFKNGTLCSEIEQLERKKEMDFGSVLRKARINAGLSQEEMAPLMFLPRSTISKLENNKMELRAKDLIAWFQITNAPEVAAAIICGVDLVAVTQLLSTLVGGVINLL